MTLILAYQNRRLVRDIAVQDSDGNPITPGSNDKVRVSIGREGATPIFTVTTGVQTVNGSNLTKGANNRLTIDAEDLAFDPGTYTMFVEFFDNADGAEWKNVDRQVFQLEST